MMKKSKNWKVNWNKIERNLFVLFNVFVFAILVYTIKTKGLSFFSTIGYFN